MATQEALIGAGQSVFRKRADDFEESGTHFVIQVFGRQLFLSGAKQSRADVGGEIRFRVLREHRCSHESSSCALACQSSTQRNAPYTYG